MHSAPTLRQNRKSAVKNKLSIIHRFCESVNFKLIETFLTEEVKNDNMAIDLLTSVSAKWQKYEQARNAYECNKVRNRKSYATELIEKVNGAASKVVLHMSAVANCKRSVGTTLPMANASLLRKAEELRNVLSVCAPLLVLLEDKQFYYNTNKRKREAEKANCQLQDDITIQCHNSTGTHGRLWTNIC